MRTNGVAESSSAGSSVSRVISATIVQEVESPFMVSPGSWMETPCDGAVAEVADAAACSSEKAPHSSHKPATAAGPRAARKESRGRRPSRALRGRRPRGSRREGLQQGDVFGSGRHQKTLLFEFHHGDQALFSQRKAFTQTQAARGAAHAHTAQQGPQTGPQEPLSAPSREARKSRRSSAAETAGERFAGGGPGKAAEAGALLVMSVVRH